MSATTTAARPRVYLAGPEVFLPDAAAIGAAKVAICARHGLEGVFPLDTALDLSGLAPRQAGLRIAAANEELLRGCDLLIANLTPFRGPSADPGTTYEMGAMRALGRPVQAYSNDPRPYPARIAAEAGGENLSDGDGALWDAAGLRVEDFGLVDNLMLAGAVHDSGGEIVTPSGGTARPIGDLAVFELCVQAVVARGLPPARPR